MTCKPCQSVHRAFSTRSLVTEWLCDLMLLTHLKLWQPHSVIELAVFSPPPFASAEEERLNKLCPVRALHCYAERTRAFRQSDQLFVCFGARAKGRPLSKPSLSRWIVE